MPETVARRSILSRVEWPTIGVDIGGTKVLAGVVDPLGNVLEKRQLPTPGHDVRQVEDTIVGLVQDLRRDFDVAAVGIGAAGFVDASRTVVMFSRTSTGVESRCGPRSVSGCDCPS